VPKVKVVSNIVLYRYLPTFEYFSVAQALDSLSLLSQSDIPSVSHNCLTTGLSYTVDRFSNSLMQKGAIEKCKDLHTFKSIRKNCSVS